MFNKKLILSIFWFLLGLAILILSRMGMLSETGLADTSLSAGFGGGLIVVGALQIVKHVRYMKDPDYRKSRDTEMSDERNSFLRMKSWSVTGYVVVLVEAVGVVVAMLLKANTLQLLLSYSVCFILVVYWFSYLILSRRY